MIEKDRKDRPQEVDAERVPEGSSTCVAPAVDVYEMDDAFIVEADMPGVDRGGIEVNIDHGLLTISGRARNRSLEGVTQLYEEVVPGDFHRAFTVGEGVDESAISAAIDDGVLVVTLPKSTPQRARKIDVK